MAQANKSIPVSLYFMPEWWDHYFHVQYPRPPKGSMEALEDIYLKRQRFLFEQFGTFGVGQEQPTLNGGQIATLLRYGYDLVPALLGVQFDFTAAWGFYPRIKTLEDVRDLEPVDIEHHPEAEWIETEKARLESRYGTSTHCIDLGSAANTTFRIIGEELYLGLLSDPAAIRDLFEVATVTSEHLYRFLRRLFPPMDPVPISNCNVYPMGPKLYQAHVLPFDARQNRFAQDLAGVAPRASVHHCDISADDFLETYARLPGLASLQASIETDIAAVKRRLPECSYSAMISPGIMNGPVTALQSKLEKALGDGADDLALWNIDVRTGPEKLNEILSTIAAVAQSHGKSAIFTAMPLCWEEMEWARLDYQPKER